VIRQLRQSRRRIRQIEINMFRGTCALQLTESSSPGAASGFASALSETDFISLALHRH